MNILAEIKKEHSKRNTVRIAREISSEPASVKELLHLVLHSEDEIARKVSWILRTCYEISPDMVTGYFPSLIRHLKAPHLHTAVKRNILGIFKTASIPEKSSGSLLDLCFGFLASGQESIAVKAFSMDIIYRWARHEPALYRELCILIEDQLPYGTSGFNSKAKRILSDKNLNPI